MNAKYTLYLLVNSARATLRLCQVPSTRTKSFKKVHWIDPTEHCSNILCDSDDLCFRSKISNKWRTKARQCADAHKLAAWVLVIDSLQTKFLTLELSCQSVSPTFEWRLKRALFFTHLTSNYVYSWKQVKEFSLRRCAGVTKGYQILTLTPSVLPTLVNF